MMLIASPHATASPPMRGVAPLCIRRKSSGRSIAPSNTASRVTSGVVKTQPMKATAKTKSKESAIELVFIYGIRPIGPKLYVWPVCVMRGHCRERTHARETGYLRYANQGPA